MARRPPARVFASVSAPRNLQSTYKIHVRNGQARGRDGVHPAALHADIAETCKRLSRNLRSGTHRFTQYRQMLISKGAGKAPRVISIPTARDRIVLKSLAELLLEVFPSSQGVIPQQRIEDVRVSMMTGKRDTYVRVDIKEFYPSVPHEVIRSRISGRIRKAGILSVLMGAISTPTVADGAPMRSAPETAGVPQGLAISNLLAEIVAQSVDSQFQKDPRVDYFRFVDDVLLLCDESNAVEICREVVRAFEEIGLTVHPLDVAGSKSQVGAVSGGFDYLGYVFRGDKITVRQSSIRRLESALARAFTRYSKATSDPAADPEVSARALAKCAWTVDLIVSGCIYKGAPRGWIEYFRQMNDLTLLKRLDVTVERFARRFNLPSEFAPKLFMRSYWILRHPTGRPPSYIPNFDEFSLDQMRHYLGVIEGIPNVDRMSESMVRDIFFKHIGREVSSLEMDIGFVS